jgi:hypothetical protein
MFNILSFLLLGTGCQTQVTQIETLLPAISISNTEINFGEVEWGETVYRTVTISNQGELPMGMHAISIEDEGFESNFSLIYYTETIICEDPTVLEVQESEDWAPNLGEGDFLLFPGCRLNVDIGYTPSIVGDAYASFHIESFIEEPPEEGDGSNVAFKPSFYRDPVHFNETVLLKGTSSRGSGRIKVTPRSLDFGHWWTGESSTKQITIDNIGNGDLEVGTPVLGTGCDPEEFSIDTSAMDNDGIVPAGHGTIFEVTFTPSDLGGRSCSLIVPSGDVDAEEVEVRLKANIGDDPTNEAPSINLVSPQIGYVHNSSEPLRFEMTMFDVNQPANTLYCIIRSQILGAGSYSCTATAINGYVEVEVPFENLTPGIDTWLVTVTDQGELQAFASTTVLFGEPFPESDDDGDGFGTEGPLIDCDDTNPTIYPNAAELVDGLDNDCDNQIDERTQAGDDDGDSVTEEEGDCNDNDIETYPGAPEQPDFKDNDCDGVIDEKTSLSDDDGDGFAEVDNDCNDRNPDIHPAAIEYCDGIDNNCNNLRDEQEGCVSIDSEPVIIGGIQMDARAISAGESTTMTLFVYEQDGQDLIYEWKEDSALASAGHSAISDVNSQTITWTAPDQVNGEGQTFSLYVLVTDEDGNQDWVFDEISVYSTPIPTALVENVTSEQNGCGSSSTAWFLPLLPLVLLGRRRQ